MQYRDLIWRRLINTLLPMQLHVIFLSSWTWHCSSMLLADVYNTVMSVIITASRVAPIFNVHTVSVHKTLLSAVFALKSDRQRHFAWSKSAVTFLMLTALELSSDSRKFRLGVPVDFFLISNSIGSSNASKSARTSLWRNAIRTCLFSCKYSRAAWNVTSFN
jgi:hypothetical protein